jgi:GDSL-like Lipase/Acylhydrolase family
MGRSVRFLALGLGLAVIVAACSGLTVTPPSGGNTPAEPSPTARSSTPPPTQPTTTAAPSVASPSPSPSAANYWPFVRSWCPGASEQPLLLIALGTSETAGYGIRSDEPYSPQEAYPGRYADILCKELGVTVELHSYFPSQSYNEWATLAWWNEHLANDPAFRADLAAAKIVVMWAMGAHDVVRPLLFGGCTGEWPAPLKACFEAATARIPAETDSLFSTVSSLVPKGTKVLAADAYFPPTIIESWATKPYWPEFRKLIDAKATVMALATKHGFTFVDTERVFNGADSGTMPAEGLFQSDGLHPTPAGALATATAFAKADGLPD